MQDQTKFRSSMPEKPEDTLGGAICKGPSMQSVVTQGIELNAISQHAQFVPSGQHPTKLTQIQLPTTLMLGDFATGLGVILFNETRSRAVVHPLVAVGSEGAVMTIAREVINWPKKKLKIRRGARPSRERQTSLSHPPQWREIPSSNGTFIGLHAEKMLGSRHGDLGVLLFCMTDSPQVIRPLYSISTESALREIMSEALRLAPEALNSHRWPFTKRMMIKWLKSYSDWRRIEQRGNLQQKLREKLHLPSLPYRPIGYPPPV